MPTPSSPRALALSTLLSVEKGKYGNIAVDTVLKRTDMSDPDRHLYTALVYGVIERVITLDYIIAALSSRSPLEVVLTLCGGADLYPMRLSRAADETGDGPAALLRLCRRSILTPDAHPDYLLRVPVKRVRELSETLRAAGLTAVSVGQVKSGGRIRVLMRQGDKDIPVANLAADTLRAYPALTLYRRRADKEGISRAMQGIEKSNMEMKF